jgi:hypothetical protein
MSSNFDNLSMAHPPHYHEDGRNFGSSDTSVNLAAAFPSITVAYFSEL